jgi:hypothetical protein
MRLARSPLALLGLVALASASCGAAPPPKVAQKPAGKSTNETPLVPYEVLEEADMARAIREYYTKYEYAIPMRDGVRLHTNVYVPKDDTHVWPMLMQRTPYSVVPYGVDNLPGGGGSRALRRFAPNPLMVKDGFIFVHQDVRGKMMSEGTFVDVRPHRTGNGPTDIDETTDAFDTVDYLVKNVPRNNGKVGVWGISYPGFYAAQAAISGHPALVAASPQAPVTEWFVGDDFHHNGAFFMGDGFDFYSSFGKPRPKPTRTMTWGFDYGTGDIYDFFLREGTLENLGKHHLEGKIPFWDDLMNHGTRDDFWKARDPRPHYKAVRPAVLTVGGFFDAEDLWGALATYKAFETQSPGATNALVMGPWRHGGWVGDGDKLGAVSFGQKTGRYYHEHVELPFFQKHLKGKSGTPVAEATCFETGTNEWRSFEAWPPRAAVAKSLYFGSRGALLSSAPSGPVESDTFTSDPQKPVPYIAHPGTDIDAEYMIDDQRFATRRPDVLVYTSPVLTEDVTLAGPVDASLFVKTTGTDADFVVKLVDVWADDAADPEPNPKGVKMGGYQQLVRAEILRGKFRNSLEKPEPFVPGQSTRVALTLPDVLHTFRRGHRIMVHVQSSWFPLVDRNPQTFVDIYHAKESDFHAAQHTVLRGGDSASGLTVRVLRGRLF